jgi:hypothetical protein
LEPCFNAELKYNSDVYFISISFESKPWL